jgi:magnesium transporter
MNEVMKVLTVMSAIFIPITFLASIYGMNFNNMPELQSPYGYYGLLGTMAVIAGGLALYFRRKRWL